MHFRTVSFFVFFSRRKGLPQVGHGFGTGLSHVANLHVGNVLQLKKTFPFLETFWISSPSQFSSGHFTPVVWALICLHSGYPEQA